MFAGTSGLEAAGGLSDTTSGRRSYRDYFEWLGADEKECKRLGFEKMCRGWAKGSKEFRKGVLEELQDAACGRVMEADAREVREERWERVLRRGLRALGKKESDLVSSPKGVDWKVALARYLRESVSAPNAWLAGRLKMGTANSVSSRVSQLRGNPGGRGTPWKKLEMLECVD